MKLKEQKENIEWVMDYILNTLEFVEDKVNTCAVLEGLVGLNHTRYELQGLIEERELAGSK